MRAKSMILIVIALGCGLVASIGISQVLDRSGEDTGKIEMVPIYVAMSDIDINEKLSANNVKLEDWPKDRVPEGAIRKLEEITDRFALTRMYEGEIITQRKVADAISKRSSVIPEGYRVCSLKVRMESAVSYLVDPGDRVDIIATFRQGRDVPRTTTKAILRNVRIFAVNTETEKELDQNGQPIVAKTVSMLVKREHVEPLMMAAELASLRLSLRRPNPGSSEEDDEESFDNSVTIQELLGGLAQDASPTPTPADTGDNGLLSFLNGMNAQPAPVINELNWRLTVLTPTGGSDFIWTNDNQMPEEVRLGAEPAPVVPAAVIPRSVPSGQESVESPEPQVDEGNTPVESDDTLF